LFSFCSDLQLQKLIVRQRGHRRHLFRPSLFFGVQSRLRNRRRFSTKKSVPIDFRLRIGVETRFRFSTLCVFSLGFGGTLCRRTFVHPAICQLSSIRSRPSSTNDYFGVVSHISFRLPHYSAIVPAS